MTLVKEKKSFRKRFHFDDRGIENAHYFLIQTIIDNRSISNLRVKILFYTDKKQTPCSTITFYRKKPKMCGVYGMKGQNEVALMRKMLAWQGKGDPVKSDVVGTLIGRNLPAEDFQRFRHLVEASGVIIEKSKLLSGGLA